MNANKIIGLVLIQAGLAIGLSGCPLLDLTKTEIEEYPLPELESTGVTLVSHPTQNHLAAHYCPQYLDSILVDVACETAFGPPPEEAQLAFFFEVGFRAGNAGDVPLPVLELLLDLKIFPELEIQSLGSTCVEFCGASDPECGGEPDPFACTDEVTDLDSREDILFRTLELIFIGMATGGDWEDFEAVANRNIRVIPPGDELLFTVRFGIGLNAMLEVLGELAEEALDQWMKGEDEFEWEIPYAVNGRAWIEVPIVGRFGLDFGPLEDRWVF